MEKLLEAIGKIANPETAVLAICLMGIGAVVQIDRRGKAGTDVYK